jgi:exodeoxyribonuclease V beta subunit
MFDPGGALPARLTVLEASAGTGKTYALAALAVRFVAEQGVAASELCIVSFTEAATAELRGRVRERLVEAVAHLVGGASGSSDPVLAALGGCGPDERRRRLAHLQAAVAEFDAATVATIHGFCRRVLSGSAVTDPDVDLIGDLDDLDEVLNDVLIARFGRGVPHPKFVSRLRMAAKARLAMSDAVVWTGEAGPAGPAGAVALAAHTIDEVCAEVARRRAAARRRSFDDLVADTRAALQGSGGASLAEALRARYRVVLVDEFQDTDRVQWDLFRTAFVDDRQQRTVVVLVGDPKQSIYRFRSADLSAYLDAVDGADGYTLGTNWRSDKPLLDGLAHLFDGFTFGSDRIGFLPVGAAPGHEHAALHGVGGAPLQVRVVGDGRVRSAAADQLVNRDVVAVVAGMLDGSVTVTRPDGTPVPLTARDIAVLTRSNDQAATLALRLGEAGIAAATSSSNSVLQSPAAMQWRILLTALERPGAAGAARAAALGWFLGYPAEQVAALDDDSLADLHDRLRAWADALTQRGVPRLLALAREAGLHHRLLSRRGGERDLTDLEHIAELLQSATAGRPAGAAALLVALDVASDDEDDAIASDTLARRIDRDDDAVQVLTIHKAKGLEFPVVLCPFLWKGAQAGGVPHADVGGRRHIDAVWVGVDSSKATAIGTAAKLEKIGENRRLLYVALTRARHRLVVWWAPVNTPAQSPLGQVLQHAAGEVTTEALTAWASRSTGTVDVTRVPADPVVVEPERPSLPDLEVAESRFVVDPAWRRWSFSSVKAATERWDLAGAVAGADDATDAPIVGGADEPDPAESPETAESAELRAPARTPEPSLALAGVPGGKEFGTLVHGVLECCDFTAPDLDAELVALCSDALRYRRLDVDPEVLAHGLAAALRAPLGGPLGPTRLADLPRGDRLDELGFDLPLGRFDAPRIGAVLADHLPADDLLRPWAESMAAGGAQTLPVAGMLNGSIDLVARSGGRYWVADYKTNQLGAASRYTRDEMAAAMIHHQYPLQAALYLVAMHRYLRWRLAGYDPAIHLGGAAYLFVRGMDPLQSADTARGVFWWQPPVAAVVALDRLLATGEAS